MAEIWLARPIEGGGKPIVLKRILPQFAADPEFLERFREEASLTLSLVHGNIVPVFEIGSVGDDPYIAMEHVPGRDLRSVLRRARERAIVAPPGVAAYIASELLRGLDYAHRKLDAAGQAMRLVHRDISPSNVVVSSEGTVKLLDFGIAKAIGRAEATRTGVLRGKVGYMSPEQARGETIGPSSDLFSTGVVLYELLTAEKLFDGESEPEVLERVKSGSIPSVRDRNPKVPEEVDRILVKALTRDPASRYPSAGEFLADLSRFLYSGTFRGDAESTAAFMRQLFPEDAAGEKADLDSRTSTHAGIPATSTRQPGPALMLGGEPASLGPGAAPSNSRRTATLFIGAAIAVAAALAWVNRDRWEVPPVAPAAGVGGVAVEARNAPEAEIWIDGAFTGKRSPALVKGVKTGTRRITLKHPDYVEWSGDVVVDARETRSVEQDLVPDLRTVTVQSEPPGAVLSAKNEKCVAPCSFRGLRPSETLIVTGERTGYRKVSLPVKVADAKDTVILRLDKLSEIPAATPIVVVAGKGKVAFRVHPGWAYLSLDGGKETDRALVDVELDAGSHELRIRAEDGSIDLRCPLQIETARTLKLRTLDGTRAPAKCPDVESVN